MDNNLLRWIVILVVVGHGIGHMMGFMAAWTNVPVGFSDRPWVLSDAITLESAVGRIFGVLWLVALAAFLGGVYGLAMHQDWGRMLLIAGSLISLVAILPWWNTVAPGPRVAASIVDVVMLVVLLTPLGQPILQVFA